MYTIIVSLYVTPSVCLSAPFLTLWTSNRCEVEKSPILRLVFCKTKKSKKAFPHLQRDAFCFAVNFGSFSHIPLYIHARSLHYTLLLCGWGRFVLLLNTSFQHGLFQSGREENTPANNSWHLVVHLLFGTPPAAKVFWEQAKKKKSSRCVQTVEQFSYT